MTPASSNSAAKLTARLKPFLHLAACLGAAWLGFAGADTPTPLPKGGSSADPVHLAVISGPLPTEASKVAALSANLPPGVLLKKASVKQTCDALHQAVLQHHDEAVDLLRIAVLARTPKQNDGKLPCPDLRRLIEAAATAAPDKTSQLVDMAQSLDPDCADDLQDYVGATSYGAFGVGFGAGLPGAPGFSGSAPGGAVAFPPVSLPTPSPTPVTSTVNQ